MVGGHPWMALGQGSPGAAGTGAPTFGGILKPVAASWSRFFFDRIKALPPLWHLDYCLFSRVHFFSILLVQRYHCFPCSC